MKNTLLLVSLLLFVFFFGPNPYVWGHTDVTPKEAKDLIDTIFFSYFLFNVCGSCSTKDYFNISKRVIINEQ